MPRAHVPENTLFERNETRDAILRERRRTELVNALKDVEIISLVDLAKKTGMAMATISDLLDRYPSYFEVDQRRHQKAHTNTLWISLHRHLRRYVQAEYANCG